MKIMRRIMPVVLLIILVFALTACGCKHEEAIMKGTPATCDQAGFTEGKYCSLCNTVLVEQEKIPPTGHTEKIIPAVAATCTTDGSTEGKTCTVCHKTIVAPKKVSALGHTTTTGTCTRCNFTFGIFSISYYVDEFKQPTKDGYVTSRSNIEGTFSNSATTNSKLSVILAADEEYITIFLYEYGSYLVKNSSSRNSEVYDITMKTASGTKYNLRGRIYPGGDRIVIDENYESTVLSALKSGGTVSFYIVQSDYTTSEYLFTVNTSNFAAKYKELFG